MLEAMFLQILNMSFTACIVIVFVLLVRLGLKREPKIFSYCLWSVVLFRLICPFSFESSLSFLGPQAVAKAIPDNIIYMRNPRIDIGIPIINDSINSVLPAATPAGSMNPIQFWIAIGTFLWLWGIVALLVYSLVSLLLLKRRLRGAVCQGGNVYIAEGLASPFVMGLFRPKIYLPDHLSAEEKRYILLHEQTHIKRHDHLVKVMAFFVLCLHWFNPLVWAAFFLWGKDMEMSCDEAVIKTLGSEVKRDYSSSLLTLATGRRIVGGSPLAFGEGDTKGRIKNVLNYKKPAFWVMVLAVVVVAVVGIGLATNPKIDRASMQWARDLRVEDIAKIELVAMPRDADKVYRLFDSAEFTDIVALINESRGRYLENPNPLAGGSITFYITTKDGVRHYYNNNGDTYLNIDGDSYEGKNDWLSSWAYKDGNAPLPLNFSLENKKLLTLDELKTIAKKGDRISWEDFAPYDGNDVGFGLYIMRYPMAEPYYVSVGGVPNEAPQYVLLFSTKSEKGIDIRQESIDDFVQSTEANTMSDLRPMLRINGDLYLDTGKESPMGATAVDGTIKSTVDQNARPTENDQSNFGNVGSSYVIGEDSVFVNIADKWIVFEKEELPIKDDFTAVTIAEHENGTDNVRVKISDSTMINQLRSLLLIGELTDMESVNDGPNKSDYIHITFEDGNEPLHCYVYVKYGKYYIERPYNGIWEISADTYKEIGAIAESIALPPQQTLIDTYYAGQGSPAFEMLQHSIFKNWVEYNDDGVLSLNLKNPKWNFDSFARYDILDKDLTIAEPVRELYYCTFSDDNGKSGYVVVEYHGDSMSKVSRVETPYLYDLNANFDAVASLLRETALDLSSAVASRVRIADTGTGRTHEAIRITDSGGQSAVFYFNASGVALKLIN